MKLLVNCPIAIGSISGDKYSGSLTHIYIFTYLVTAIIVSGVQTTPVLLKLHKTDLLIRIAYITPEILYLPNSSIYVDTDIWSQ